MKMIDAIEAFIGAKQAKGLSPRTLEGYRIRLNIFAKYNKELPTTAQPIESFLAKTGPTQETRDTYYRLLRTFYKWLLRRRWIRKNQNPIPRIEAPLLRPKVARALTAEQLGILLAYPVHSKHVHAFLYLLADTGLRLSEALGIDHPDKVGLDTVIAAGKTGEREVPISPKVAAMVLDALPWPWSSRYAAGLAIRRAFNYAGFSGKRASAHTLRHTFVRLWDGDESLLIGMMGWTSSRMLEIYRPYNIAKAVQQHRQYTPIIAAEEKRAMQTTLF